MELQEDDIFLCRYLCNRSTSGVGVFGYTNAN